MPTHPIAVIGSASTPTASAVATAGSIRVMVVAVLLSIRPSPRLNST